MPRRRPEAPAGGPARLERRGRWWLAVSFLACPCHLPITLTALGAALGGTAAGAALRQHALLAGAVVALAWAAGTAQGFRLLARARRDGLSCPVPAAGPPG